MEFLEKMRTKFGAKYVAEDAASYILYCFDHSVLDGRAVPLERLAHFLGLDIRCEYLTGDCTESIGIVAFEPQRIYTMQGHLDLPVPTAVVERDSIDRGENGVYRFALALMCAEYLFYAAEHDDGSAQLSFGLDSVASRHCKNVSLEDAFGEMERHGEGAATFALKLALPKNGFKRRTVELYAELGVNRATVDSEKHLPQVLEALSAHYGVPEVAVLARMRQLNLY